MSTSATALSIARFDQSTADLIALIAMVREDLTHMDQRNNAWNAANRQPLAYRCADKLIKQTADTLAMLGELGLAVDFDDYRERMNAVLREEWEDNYRSAWEETEQDGESEIAEHFDRSFAEAAE